MIYCLGLTSELENVQQHLDENVAFRFSSFELVNAIENLDEADLVLVGPAFENPARAVQQIVARDKHISVIVFTESTRYSQVKQSIQFSLAVGKNTSCVIYRPDWNYTSILQNAIVRTKQKRSFSKFNRSADAILSQLDSPVVKLDNLGDILEHAPIGVILVDNTFNIVGANKASRRMFNVLDGNSVRLETILPARYTEIVRQFVGGTETMLTVEDYNGNHYEISASAIPGHDVDRMILLINDITERYEKDKRFTAILESLPQIAWTADENGSINYYNQGWFDYTNRDPAEGMGDGWAAIIHPEDLDHVKARWAESIRDGKMFQHASRFRRFDGEYRWHLSKAVPILAKNRRITTWVGTSTDIHDQVKLNEELERKVKERTKLLEDTNAELEQFAHISSHDLQEPLRKVQTFAHIISDVLPPDLNENKMARKYIDKIITTSNRMSQLLKDLLKYSKINQQEPPSVINLNDIIDEIKEDLELAITQSGATIKVEQLPVLGARPLQIKQLFYNLISNGLKYRKPDISPTISVSCQKLSMDTQQQFKNLGTAAHWEIIVKDNGIGFDQQYARQIFTVFQRLHTRSAYEGTGIGLAIAKKVVNNHGGEIFAVSSPGEGSEFHVVLPEFKVNELPVTVAK